MRPDDVNIHYDLIFDSLMILVKVCARKNKSVVVSNGKKQWVNTWIRMKLFNLAIIGLDDIFGTYWSSHEGVQQWRRSFEWSVLNSCLNEFFLKLCDLTANLWDKIVIKSNITSYIHRCQISRVPNARVVNAHAACADTNATFLHSYMHW